MKWGIDMCMMRLYDFEKDEDRRFYGTMWILGYFVSASMTVASLCGLLSKDFQVTAAWFAGAVVVFTGISIWRCVLARKYNKKANS